MNKPGGSGGSLSGRSSATSGSASFSSSKQTLKPANQSSNRFLTLLSVSSKTLLSPNSIVTTTKGNSNTGGLRPPITGGNRPGRNQENASVSSANPLFGVETTLGVSHSKPKNVSGHIRTLSNRWKGYLSRGFQLPSRKLLPSLRGNEQGGTNIATFPTENLDALELKTEREKVNMAVSVVRERCIQFTTMMFPITTISLEDLEVAAAYMLWDVTPNFDTYESFTCTVDFVGLVRKYYVDNPYHSFRHVVDVMQMMYILIKETDVGKYALSTPPEAGEQTAHRFSGSSGGSTDGDFDALQEKPAPEPKGVYRRDTFAFELLIACLCHDLGHNGASNQHLRETNHEWVKTYGRSSTMERLHASLMETLLQSHPMMQYFGSTDLRQRMTKEIEHFILSTDMELHGKLLSHFKDAYSKDPQFSTSIGRRALGILLVKVCDISNVSRPLSIAQEWSLLLSQEHAQLRSKQSKEEDIGKHVKLYRVAQATHSFILKIVSPMCEVFRQVCPQASEMLQAGMRSNATVWESYLAQPESFWASIDNRQSLSDCSLGASTLAERIAML